MVNKNKVTSKVNLFLDKVRASLIKLFQPVSFILGKAKASSFFKSITSPIVGKTLIIVLVILGLAQFIFGLFIYGFKSESKSVTMAATVVPYPVFITNLDAVTYNQFLAEKRYIHHFYEATNQSNGIDFASIDKEIGNQLIDNKLVNFESKIHAVKIDNQTVNKTFDQISEQNGGNDNVANVLDDLYGLNVDQFKKLIKVQLLREKINTDIIAKVEARHILVRVSPDDSPEKIEQARVKAEGYKNEIAAGLDFAEAAKKYSEDIGSAEAGGLLEPFAKGEMVEQFSDAAFNASAGDLIGPIRTDFGWHVIRVEKKTGRIEKPFIDWLNDVRKNSLIIKLI